MTWAEICTSFGAKRVVIDAQQDSGASDPVATNLLGHCPFCVLHDGFPVPSTLASVAPPNLLADLLPLAFLQADQTLSVWAKAQPRAPPVLI